VLVGVGDGEEIAGRTQRHALLLVVVAHVVVELALDLPVHDDRREMPWSTTRCSLTDPGD
jgi:hypothetical protein